MATWKEKLVKIKHHWEEHLQEHAEEFQKWANNLEEEGEKESAEKLRQAAELLLKVKETLPS
ncbi:hypothetical protein Thein_0485 [Thermodesulfatator indicus DSM 15286]|uniref:DUF8180 domain-containing protein n=1 Tax=Thermodesulfatator indicus (strain DSM 15286 / JCM 11887 / CIR29812) TaxID=667014 RepID=F8AB01_THEID|nr:hypothetical protein [Thermodesulfatator indicus]AEH44367.1 hypothetical protein Thein_0485 [Thermodesulfatator indicus DSM 15286]